MIKKIIIIVSIIVVLGGGIWYLQQGEDFNLFDNSNDVEVKYSESQTVNLSMEKVRTLNPVVSKDVDTYKISKLIFESLFYFDEKLSLVNGLAESYSYDEDKTSVNIKIKSNSYFSNGENVTGADVKYSIDNYVASYGNTIYSSYVSNIRSVSVDRNDRYSINVKFKDKRDVSMENFVFPIVSQKSFGKTSAAKMTSGDFIPVGSGPYAIEKYNDITELILSANGYYSGTKPQNKLCFTIIPEKEDVIPLLEVSNVSIGFLETLSRDTLISDKKITTTNFPSNEVDVVGYNFSKTAMANKKVRKAIAFAINNEELNELAYYQNGMMNDSLYFPEYLGSENTGDNYKFNLEKSKELLISANYLDRDGNGYLEDAEENELTIEILVNGADASKKLVAESIKESMDKLTISSRIVYATDLEDFSNKLNAKAFDIFVGGIKINETYDLRSLLHSEFYNTIGYSNGKLDILLDRLKSGISEAEKLETVNQIKDILIDEIPYYCIVYKTYGALSSQAISGDEQQYMFNNVYNGCESWYCKYPIKEKVEEEVPMPKEEETVE